MGRNVIWGEMLWGEMSWGEMLRGELSFGVKCYRAEFHGKHHYFYGCNLPQTLNQVVKMSCIKCSLKALLLVKKAFFFLLTIK